MKTGKIARVSFFVFGLMMAGSTFLLSSCPKKNPVPPPPPSDLVAPAAVTDLLAGPGSAAGSIELIWTATGDDGNTGTAQAYVVKYSTSFITAANFDTASSYTQSWTPLGATGIERRTVTGLTEGQVYHFALKVLDEVPNTSSLSNVPSESPPHAVSPVPNRDSILATMGAIILPSIQRNDTSHPVFHGCFDWHSAVHGHWALLRIGRVSPGGAAGAQAADASMTEAGIAQEADYLRTNPFFEMPYGRAWFLRLAVEHERWCLETATGNPLKLRAMADEVAGSLRTFYGTTTPSPATAEYSNGSWALAQLHAYLHHTCDPAGLSQVGTHVQSEFLGVLPAIDFGEDAGRSEFFSRFGNWAYLIATARNTATLTQFLSDHPVVQAHLASIATLLPGAHHLGMNWSRSWALRALSRRAEATADRTRFDTAFLDHVQTAMGHHALNAGNYFNYDHWVPQFAVYALTEGE